jgi:hypothetical protein
MKPERQPVWNGIRDLALGLDLPHVEETTSYGQPALKAHGRLWVWWSPHEDAPIFKVAAEEREVLLGADPDTFFVTDHYRGGDMVLVRPEKLDPDWLEANLLRVWRALASKRVLEAYDAASGRVSPSSRASRPPRGSRHRRRARRR